MEKVIKVHNPDNLKTVEYAKLEYFQGDLKKINKKSLQKLVNSIIEHGVFVPKFVWKDEEGKYLTIDGHQTKKALIQLELDGYEIPEIPIVQIFAIDKTDAAKKILQLNSNYGKINPETDFFERLEVPIEYLKEVEIQELDIKIKVLNASEDEEDEFEPVAKETCILKVGDIIEIGEHRVMCGDANLQSDVDKLFNWSEKIGFRKTLSNVARMAILDPPYDIEYYDWVDIIPNYIENAYCFIICDDQQVQTILKQTDLKLQRFFVLDHTFSSPKGNDVYVRHLLMMRLVSGKPIPFKNLQDGFQSIIKMNYRGFLKREEQVLHPHQKPVSLYNKFIKHFSDEGSVVADMFLGSGTLLISCERMGRKAIGMELDPLCLQNIVSRICKERADSLIILNGEEINWNEYRESKEVLSFEGKQ